MSFLKELKVAVINRDLKTLEELSKKTPNFSSIEEAKEILSYINLAKNIIEEEKLKLSKEMKKIRQLKKFQKQKESFFSVSS